ncbi:AraC family transcriptional regulator [Catenulispora subtropica]|uniref:AraC family transcriptional regulator n=1 Tax=Catenulispora subtropica TaxID=450798 RepID=A0ABN2T708_9ACTN
MQSTTSTTAHCDAKAQEAVARAIEIMWERYREPLSLSDIARAALLSQFHFSRVFRAVTGTSPFRFLAAVRLHQAKRLLLESGMSVTDIAFEVGYSSLGTFTSRFTSSVGVPPARYRRLARHGMPLPATGWEHAAATRGGMRGLIRMPSAPPSMRIYVGAFDSPIVQGAPVSCDILDGPGPYRLAAVPDGEWHVRAAAVPANPRSRALRLRPLAVGTPAAVLVRGGRCVDVDVDLRPAELLDTPILLALPELDRGGEASPARLVREFAAVFAA